VAFIAVPVIDTVEPRSHPLKLSALALDECPQLLDLSDA
jgi:hypothetical protein